MSRGGKFYVVRTCNPTRTQIGKGVPLLGKNLEIKAKSFKSGIHKGKVGVDQKDIAKLKERYDFQTLPQNTGYRLKLKPGKSGDLNNHVLENTSHTATGVDSGKMVLLDASNRPYIPDVDRLVCMELAKSTNRVSQPKLKNMAKYGDDPDEVARFNRELNRHLKGKRINKEAARHGYTSSNVKDGKPIWHADSNEFLLVFVEGKIFEMTWNYFVLFCRINKALDLPQCFNLVHR